MGGIATGLATGGVGALPAAAYKWYIYCKLSFRGGRTLAVTEFLEAGLLKPGTYELNDREGIEVVQDLVNEDALDNIRMRALGLQIKIGLVETIFGGLAGGATKAQTKLSY